MTDVPTRVRASVPATETIGSVGAERGLRIAGALALLPTAAILLVRVGINAPFAPGLPYSTVYDPIATLALLGPAIGAILIGVTTHNDVYRVALAFAGVFGLLSAIAGPAALPASVAIVAAVGLVLLTHARRPFSPDEVAQTVVGGVFLAGVALSMAGGLGIEAATTRPLGSSAILLAIAGAPVFVDWSLRSAFVGVLAGAAFAGFGLAAPFVTGAASLVGGAIVGVSLPVLVLAVVGGVTIVATGIERRTVETTTSGLLLLTAGVPATIPRGLALLLGLAILLQVSQR